jgi:hypothetical protein
LEATGPAVGADWALEAASTARLATYDLSPPWPAPMAGWAAGADRALEAKGAGRLSVGGGRVGHGCWPAVGGSGSDLDRLGSDGASLDRLGGGGSLD